MLAAFGKRADDCVGEHLPALVLVASRAMGSDGQRRIEKKHALISPLEEIGHVAELLRDVDKRRRRRDFGWHVEREPLRLPRLVVWVLPEYHDLDLVERRAVERVEYLSRRRIDDAVPVGGLYEADELGEVGLLELLCKYLLPGLLNLDFHVTLHCGETAIRRDDTFSPLRPVCSRAFLSPER